MFDFSSLNENTELRDNILNAEINDTDVFGKLDTDTINAILKSANGIGFSQTGDIIGRDGKVVHKVADVRNALKTHYSTLNEPNPLDFASVIIDGVSHTINDKGEAVDAAGKVVKTFDEVKSLLKEGSIKDAAPDPTDIAGIIESVNASLGIEFKDEQGNPLTFEPTVEGLAARDKYIIDNVAAQIANESVRSIFNADPDFESLYLYKKQNNGSSLGWGPTPDYSKVSLLPATDANAEKQYADLIIKAEIAQGRDAKTAEMLAKYLIDDGKGEETAKNALATINRLNVEKVAADRAAAEKEELQRAADIENYWKEVKNVLDKGNANGIAIPAFISIKGDDGVIRNVPRQAVYDFMAKPVKDGKSALQLFNSQMTVEDRIVDALMKLTKYNYGDVVKATAANKQVEFIRRARSGANNSASSQGAGGKAPVDMVAL